MRGEGGKKGRGEEEEEEEEEESCEHSNTNIKHRTDVCGK